MKITIHDQLERFIYSLQKPTIAKILRSLDLLEEYGHELKMPHVKSLSDGLYELRVRGKQEVRIFFVYRNNQAVLFYGFIKKTQKTPSHELHLAKKILTSLS